MTLPLFVGSNARSLSLGDYRHLNKDIEGHRQAEVALYQARLLSKALRKGDMKTATILLEGGVSRPYHGVSNAAIAIAAEA
jgi:hypothetical protein